MSLKTGRRIHANKWTEVPTSQEIIDRVHHLAQGAEQQWYGMKSLTFESDPGTPILDNTPIYNDVTYHEEVINNGHIEIDDRVAAAAENINDNESVEETPEEESMVDSDSTFLPNEEPTDDEDYQPDISEVDSQDFEFNLANVHEIDEGNSSRSTDTSSLDTYVTESEVIDLTQDSPILHATGSTEAQDSLQLMGIGTAYKKALSVMFTQISASRGIKLFGKKAVTAIFKELKQLNDGVLPGNQVIVPIDIESLTEEDKRKSLEAVNLIKVKRCGKIKGRTCANGSRQKHFVKAEDNFTSSTALLEYILTTLIIEAHVKSTRKGRRSSNSI